MNYGSLGRRMRRWQSTMPCSMRLGCSIWTWKWVRFIWVCGGRLIPGNEAISRQKLLSKKIQVSSNEPFKKPSPPFLRHWTGVGKPLRQHHRMCSHFMYTHIIIYYRSKNLFWQFFSLSRLGSQCARRVSSLIVVVPSPHNHFMHSHVLENGACT